MMERLTGMSVPEPNKPAHTRCRDCGGKLPPPAKASSRDDSSPDQYCPPCAEAVAAPTACPHCGSLVCPRCGTPVEQVDELGMG